MHPGRTPIHRPTPGWDGTSLPSSGMGTAKTSACRSVTINRNSLPLEGSVLDEETALFVVACVFLLASLGWRRRMVRTVPSTRSQVGAELAMVHVMLVLLGDIGARDFIYFRFWMSPLWSGRGSFGRARAIPHVSTVYPPLYPRHWDAQCRSSSGRASRPGPYASTSRRAVLVCRQASPGHQRARRSVYVRVQSVCDR